MDPIKEAFSKIKQDILSIQEQIYEIKQNIQDLKTPKPQQYTPEPRQSPLEPRQYISELQQSPEKLQQYPSLDQTMPINTPTQQPPYSDNQTQTPTMNYQFHTGNSSFSIGNEGVPTDKQTNQQTNRQSINNTGKFAQPLIKDQINEFQQVHKVLDSLDSIKKEIRLKFKRLTPQEMLVFSTLYHFDEQKITEITYKLIANNLNLSESSIRDYINKLVTKGVPITKTRQNNKKITLRISEDLKNIATLATINKLRDL